MAAADRVLGRARAAGVVGCVCCGTREEDWAAVAQLARQSEAVLPAFGLHPWFVRSRGHNWLARLRELLVAHPRAAVGEIGLDGALKDGSEQDQALAFREQLRLARELHRPISIHCRRAWEPLLGALREAGPLPAGFVVHSYSGSAEQIAPLADLGGFFSFSGSLTWPTNQRSRKAAAAVPEERLLIETDAPDLLPHMPDQPQPAHGEPNEPANLVYVLRELSAARKVPSETLGERLLGNALRLFPALAV